VLSVPESPDAPGVDIDIDVQGNILNEPPTADAGDDQVVECTSPDGAEITLDGTGSTDPEDNISLFAWSQVDDATGQALDTVPVVHVVQPNGTTESYFLSVLDAFMRTDGDSTSVRVEDSTAPTFGTIKLAHDCLWPPIHRYVRFELGRDIVPKVTDACDASPAVAITNVTSDQPDDAPGLGDGRTTQDIIFSSGGLCVRSERGAAERGGRTYTITLAATDASGNTTNKDVTIQVPPSRRGCSRKIRLREFVRNPVTECTFPASSGG
jgi:hypothetical protein